MNHFTLLLPLILISCSNIKPLGYGQGRRYKVVFVKPNSVKTSLEKAKENFNNKEEVELPTVSPVVNSEVPKKEPRKKRRKLYRLPDLNIVAEKKTRVEIVNHQLSSIARNKDANNLNSRYGYTSFQHKKESSLNSTVTDKTFTFGNQRLDFPKKNFDFWVDHFARKTRSRFLRFHKNGESFKNVIHSILKKHNLPTDLYYVGFIESGYYTSAESHADAVGPWQFIKGTAKRYGLRVDRSVDERRNIYKATEAAALYFKDLYNIFGSWELAMCAYNAGEYRVINAIRDGRTRNFHELVRKNLLPKETVNYVPKVMAAKHLHEKGEKYGILFPKHNNSIFDSVYVSALRYPFSLKAISESTKIPFKTLKKLNSDINHKWTHVSYKRPHKLYLPKGMGSGRIYTKLIEQNSNIDTSLQKYSVQTGDSLLAIAYKFDVGLNDLKKANNLESNNIKVGQKLIIPTVKSSKTVHVVKKGESIFAIAKMYDVSLNEIYNANSLKSGKIFPGQKIVVPQDI